MKRRIFMSIMCFTFFFCLSLLLAPNTGVCASKKPKMNVKKLSLSKNTSYTLRVYNVKKNYTVSFASSDTSVVTVSKATKSKNTIVTAANIGTATVQANIYNRKGRLVRTLKTNVTVTPYAISIKFTHKKVKLNVGNTLKLSIITKPNTSQEIPLFSSSDSNVVTINSKGVITGIAPGDATITATLLSNGQKTSCRVYITPNPSATPSVVYGPQFMNK